MTDDDGTDAPAVTPPLSWRIVGGGEPSPEQLAALTIALLADGVADPGKAPRGELSGWASAAMAEAVGGRPAYSATDVRRIRYLRPHPG